MAKNTALSSVKPLRPTTVRECVDAYLALLRRRGRAPKTTTKYALYLDAFAEWAGERTPAELSTTDIDFGFLGDWSAEFERRNGRQASSASLRATIGAIGGLYRFAVNYGFLVDADGRPVRNPALALEAPPVKQKQNDWLRGDDDNRLLDLPMKPHEEILIWFLRWTGLRVSEALSLRWSDIDLVSGTVSVPTSKTKSGIRQVPITPELAPRIRRWAEHLREKGVYNARGPFLATTIVRSYRDRASGRVLQSVPGRAMSPQQVELILRRVGERADIDGRVTPHRLRRTYGSYLLNSGVRLESVSKLLGHANTSITEKAYASMLDETIRVEVMAALR
jgi:integrase